MARPALDLGQRTEAETIPQWQAGERWVKLPAGQPSRSAKRWRARLRLRGYDGVIHDVSAIRTVKRDALIEVQRKADALLAAGSRELSEATPVSQAAALWLEQIERADSNLSAETIRQYRSALDRYVLSESSSVRGLTLGQLNAPSRVRAFLQGVADKHGTASAKTVKSVVSNLLNFALEDGALTMNAARQVRPVRSQSPKESTHDTTRALTRDERATLLAHVKEEASVLTLDPRTTRKREAVSDVVHFMAGTGVRIGEALGVRWEHVNLSDGYVQLHGTKSRSARRRLDFPAWLVEELEARTVRLRAHYRRALVHAKRTDSGTRADVVAELQALADDPRRGFLFASPARLDPERAWDRSNASNALRLVLDGAGFEWATPHSLRRTAITWLGESGVPLAKVADFAGHSDPAMTASVYLGRDFEGDKSGLAAIL